MKTFFNKWGRKKTPMPDLPNQPQGQPHDYAPQGGEMAANLSADVLMPETRNLLKSVSEQIGFGTKVSTSSGDAITPQSYDVDPTAAPPSEGMQKLLNDLSKKLFPHRHSSDEKATNPSILLKKLREDLANHSPKAIADVTPTPSAQEDLDPTAAAILARTSLEPASAEAAETKGDTATGKSVSGDTKPEHASQEALANPFSLVNINRGASSAVAITPSVQHQDVEEPSKRKSRRKQTVERATINYKKKLVQSRFSRRRFLREYSSNTILGAIFSFLVLIGFTVGTIVTNVSVIIPQTKLNQEAGKQSEAFRNQIDRDQPKLTGLLQRRQSLETKLNNLIESFVTSNQIRDDFTAFLNLLDEDPRVEVSEQTIEALENELPGIEAISVSFRVKTKFLLWLKYRNQMIRTYQDINVIQETITAPPGVSTVDIFIQMSRTGRNN